MKKLLLYSLALFAIQSYQAQLWVNGNDFIFSKGGNISVKKEINLAVDASVYLRGEAQLLQKDNLVNTGQGILSIFQEGTSNAYTYNYWSSPVSEPIATNGNTGFKNAQIYYPITGAPTTIDDFTIAAEQATILPNSILNGVSDDGTTNNKLEIAGRWLYTYDSGGSAITGYAGWSRFNDPNTVVASGYGFTMKGVDAASLPNSPNYRNFNGLNGQRYDFRGRPNNGTILVGVGNDNNTLAGNPYPSALDLKRFLEENSKHTSGNDVKIDPWVSFWESQVETSHFLVDYLGGYAQYVPLGFAVGTDGYITDGQYISAIFRRTRADGTIDTGTAQGTSTLTPGKRRYAAVGQGFFISRTNTDVAATATTFAQTRTANLTAGTNLTSGVTGDRAEFNNTMRVFQKENGNSSIFKNAATSSNDNGVAHARQLPKMVINVIPNGLYARPLYFIFEDSTSQAYDHAWEAPISGRIPTDAYIKIGTGEYALSSQAFDENMVLPLGVQVSNTFTTPISVEFEVADLVNFNPTNIYLHDIENNVYHDIKTVNKTLLIAPGHYTDKFEITFKNTTGTLGTATLVSTDFTVFQNNRNSELTILNPHLHKITSISLFDLTGRKIFSDQPVSDRDAQYTFDTSNLSNAIYITKITTAYHLETSVKVSITN